MAEHEKVYKYIDDHFADHVKATQRLLQQPSISLVEPGQGQDVVKCAHMIKDMIAALGAQRAEVVNFPQGFPVVFGRLNSKRPNAKTIGCYSLYDVMPVEGENWVTPPFDAAIVDAEKIDLPSHYGKCIVARGARNQKGPIMGLLNALKSMLDTTGDIPVNVVFVFDGEEELGSMNLCGPFRQQYLEELRQCDAGYYLNPSQNVRGDCLIYLGNRGISFMEMNVKGGAWGGPSKPLFAMHDLWVDSPMWTLVQALASLKAPDGTVLLDGFYDDVKPLSEESKKLIEILANELDEREMYREYRGAAVQRREVAQGAVLEGSLAAHHQHGRYRRRLHRARRKDNVSGSRQSENGHPDRTQPGHPRYFEEAPRPPRQARLRIC